MTIALTAKRMLLLLVCLFITGMAAMSQLPSAQLSSKSFLKTGDGVIIYPDTGLAGHTHQVQLRVIADNIIRVTASPNDMVKERSSLVVLDNSKFPAQWNIKEAGDAIIVKTNTLIATANLLTGAVSFTDINGKAILAEKAKDGRHFEPAVYEGTPSYTIRQTFETTPGDAYYGLGQHQDDVFNYKNQQVTLFQNNTEVAIPFLISSKNYGILWDNYAVSRVGDIRPYQSLSTLRLFSAKDEQGWLTTSYYNDKDNPTAIALQQAESAVNYAYLNDTNLHLPKEFNIARGKVVWEGSIASPFTGTHKFRFTYAGYAKVWIDGKLLLDRWRQAWNPGTGVLNLPLEANKKYPVKIEWIPDGGESYLSANWLPPVVKEDENSFSFLSEAGQQSDYYFIYGEHTDEVIAGYRNITGQATLLPKWVFGFWQSRERYKTQDEILNTVDTFRKRKIPLDNIVLDWSYWKQADWGSQEFDPARFPHPDSMISVLHKKYHTQLMISVWPKFYEGIDAYNTFNKNGWLYKRNIADRQKDWIANGYVSTFYDAFNEKARKGFWDLLNDKLYRKGVDAWWMDASEPDILSNVSPERRKLQMTPTALGSAAEYLNAYPLENARGIYEGQRSVDADKRVFILTRSAFAGQQRYAAATWSGDIASRWYDMKAQISAGINFSLSGIPYWTMDAGGFSVEHRYEHPNEADLEEWREQTTRWYQFGAFCPIFRVHGQYPYREIYNTAPENHMAYKSMLYYDVLRYRLLPYIYSLAGQAYHRQYTIMRGLVMDYAKDTAALSIGDAYMLGPSLYINPVYTYGARTRNIYLPAGNGWYDLYTGKYYNGGRQLVAAAPYEKIPVLVKEGSIIPFGPALQYVNEKQPDTITLFVYTGKDASFNLYEDDGNSYAYEKGSFTNIPIGYNESKQSVTIGNRSGAYNGMLTKRTFRMIWVDPSKPKALEIDAKADAVIKYNGSVVTIYKNK